MPRQNWSENRNINRLPLTEEFPDTLACVRIFVPNRQYYFTLLIGALNRLAKQIYYERDEHKTAKKIAEQWKQANQETFGAGFLDCNGEHIPIPPSDESGISGCGYDFYDLIEMILEHDMKFSLDGKLYEPAIPLVECGCDDGALDVSQSDTGGSGAIIPDATSGSVWGSDVTTVCDFITSGTDYLLNEVDNVVGAIQTGAWVLDAIDFIDSFTISGWIDDVRGSITDIENELQDSDFRVLLENRIAKYFDDPITTDVTRFGLYRFALGLPLVFEGAPMRAAFVLWALGANMQSVNSNIRSWSGTGNYANCDFVAARVGRPLYNPANNAPLPPTEFEQLLSEQSGFTNLRMVAVKFARIFGYLESGATPIPKITDLAGTDVTIRAIGFSWSANAYNFNFNIARRAGSQYVGMLGINGATEAASGNVSGATGLSQATQDEIAALLNTFAAYTPDFSSLFSSQNMVAMDSIEFQPASVASNAGTIESATAFVVVSDN